MTISKFLNDKFNLDVICDEEGVYSYIIHTIDDKVKLDKVSSNITFSNQKSANLNRFTLFIFKIPTEF